MSGKKVNIAQGGMRGEAKKTKVVFKNVLDTPFNIQWYVFWAHLVAFPRNKATRRELSAKGVLIEKMVADVIFTRFASN